MGRGWGRGSNNFLCKETEKRFDGYGKIFVEISQREKIPGIEVQTTGIERKECLKQSLRLANPHPPLNPLPSREGNPMELNQSTFKRRLTDEETHFTVAKSDVTPTL